MLPASKKNQQLIDVPGRGGDLAGCALVNVMEVKTKVAVSERGSELRKIEGRVEQTYHALRGMHSDHLFYLGERTHDDLHKLRRRSIFEVRGHYFARFR